MTTASYSGIIGIPSIASIASSEWLVTTRWLRWAFSRARSAKHSWPNGHLAAPRQSRWVTLTCRHSRSLWRGAEARPPGAAPPPRFSPPPRGARPLVAPPPPGPPPLGGPPAARGPPPGRRRRGGWGGG